LAASSGINCGIADIAKVVSDLKTVYYVGKFRDYKSAIQQIENLRYFVRSPVLLGGARKKARKKAVDTPRVGCYLGRVNRKLNLLLSSALLLCRAAVGL
jgi:hypothetical protein